MPFLKYFVVFVLYFIIQGQITSAAFIVSIQDAKSKHHYCSGAILNEVTVLTSASCLHRSYGRAMLSPNSIKVATGSNNANPISLHKVSNVIKHEKFNIHDKSLFNDIAIVEVTPPFELNESLNSVKLPKPNQTLKSGDTATIVGWGSWLEEKSYRKEELLVRQVKIKDNNECALMYLFYGVHVNQRICATSHCLMDAGGPLTIDDNTIMGINVSGGCNSKPDVYTLVSDYIDWIEENMNGSCPV